MSEVLKIRGYDPERDRYNLRPRYVLNVARTQESKTRVVRSNKEDIRANRNNVVERLGFLCRLVHGVDP